MREKVLEFLRGKGLPEERYNDAMYLYRKSEGKSIPAVDAYSRAGFTASNLKNICYDLQKLHHISDAELATKAVDPSKAAEAQKKKDAEAAKLKIAQDKKNEALKALATYDSEVTAYNDAKKIAIGLDLKLDDMKGDTIKAALIAEQAKLLVEKTSTNGPEKGINGPEKDQNGTDFKVEGKIVVNPSIEELLAKASPDEKKGLTLRQRFAFLSEDDCPDKFKVLVADMLTAWDKYKQAHASLLLVGDPAEEKQLTDAEIYALGKEAIESFEKNHAIWDELEYYNEHKEILGNHPIFADDVLKEAVANLAPTKLVTRRNTLRSYVSRESKKLEKEGIEEANAKKIREKIQKYNQELLLINERLGEK